MQTGLPSRAIARMVHDCTFFRRNRSVYVADDWGVLVAARAAALLQPVLLPTLPLCFPCFCCATLCCLTPQQYIKRAHADVRLLVIVACFELGVQHARCELIY